MIIDLHAAEGSQNRFEHSGTRDGETVLGGVGNNGGLEEASGLDCLVQDFVTEPCIVAASCIFANVKAHRTEFG